jgi:hypothetical protein
LGAPGVAEFSGHTKKFLESTLLIGDDFIRQHMMRRAIHSVTALALLWPHQTGSESKRLSDLFFPLFLPHFKLSAPHRVHASKRIFALHDNDTLLVDLHYQQSIFVFVFILGLLWVCNQLTQSSLATASEE